MLNLQSNHWAR